MSLFSILNCPIIHNLHIAQELFRTMETRTLEIKYTRPEELDIITIHNRKDKSLFERSLEYLGINDYVCLRHPEIIDWNNKYKLILLLSYLRKHTGKEKFILFCDAFDSILKDDPDRVLDIFRSFQCKMLFMSTMASAGYPDEYSRIFAEKHNISENNEIRHLNSGVFMGEKQFVIQVLEDCVHVIKEIEAKTHPLTKAFVEYYGKESDRYLRAIHDGDTIYIADQNIFRYLYPKFYPGMKIDLNNELAYRY